MSLPRSGQFCWLVQTKFPRGATNQKHCPYLSGGMSSVWNFCARSWDAGTPFRGETSGADVAKCRLFSQANKEQNHKKRKTREHQEDIRGIIVKRDLQTIFAQKLSSLVTKVMSSEREKGRKYTISLMRPRNSSRLKWSCQRKEDFSFFSGEILKFFSWNNNLILGMISVFAFSKYVEFTTSTIPIHSVTFWKQAPPLWAPPGERIFGKIPSTALHLLTWTS